MPIKTGKKSIFDVIIVGAGPAGLLAAYELVTRNPKIKVCIIEKGNKIEKRARTEVMSGVGGAGTFSDGKLHLTPLFSHEKLYQFYSKKEVEGLLLNVDKIFRGFGMDCPIFPNDNKKTEAFIARAQKSSVNLLIRKLRHIGSDKLPGIIKSFQGYLEKNGVKIASQTEALEVLTKSTRQVKGVKTNKGNFYAEKVLISPGRLGASWVQTQARKLNLKYTYQPIWIGLRVEFPMAVMKEFADVTYESIFYLHGPTFDDPVRTYCHCPNGFVTKETYNNFVCVNGESRHGEKSPNSNFALLAQVALTQPVENTIAYGETIGRVFRFVGGEKPILQRLSDLQRGRRSTWERLKKCYIQPTFTDVTPGDLAMALPGRILTNLLEAIEKIDKILPGLNSESTLLYGPEIKFTSTVVEVDENMESKISGLYFAGDGAGLSGNISGAAATGLIAARGILKKN